MRNLLLLLAALSFSSAALATESDPCQGGSPQACDDALADIAARLAAAAPGDAQGEAAALAAAAAEVAYAFDDAGEIELAFDLIQDYLDAVEAGVDPEEAGVTLLQSHAAFELAAPLLYLPGMDPGVPMADQDPVALRICINWEKVKWFVNEFFAGVWDILTVVWDLYQMRDTGP
ncbi:MAG: hypothetical protein H6741_14570 [Alphaproteobacteria bacterium]|nr:hypothetical protein [Alphaproteobacteria bacterium]